MGTCTVADDEATIIQVPQKQHYCLLHMFPSTIRRAMSTPKYIYKVLPHSSVDPRFTFPIPIPASHQLILPQLDLDDGFVHTSSALQTHDTLRLFFKDIEGVWILKINAERLANWRKIDWVQGSGVDTNEKAPKHIVAHLHRPWLSGEEVESVRPLFKVDGSWAKALEEKEISAFME